MMLLRTQKMDRIMLSMLVLDQFFVLILFCEFMKSYLFAL